MTASKKQSTRPSLEAARRALETLTPAEAETLRRLYGVELSKLEKFSGINEGEAEDDEALKRIARELVALKKRRKH